MRTAQNGAQKKHGTAILNAVGTFLAINAGTTLNLVGLQNQGAAAA
jgi:hypothetical protein